MYKEINLLALTSDEIEWMREHFTRSYFSSENKKTHDKSVRSSKSGKHFHCLFDIKNLKIELFGEQDRKLVH